MVISKAIQGLTIGFIIALWVLLLSDNSLKIVLAVVFGYSGSLVYYVITQEEFLYKTFSFPEQKILIAFFIIFPFVLFIAPVISIYDKLWFNISILNWIRFAVSIPFCVFFPGFLILRCLDLERRISLQAHIVLSTLLSLFFTSIFWYFIEILLIPTALANLLFLTSQLALLFLYFRTTIITSKATEQQRSNLYESLALGSLALLSVFLVFLQQFIYNPFIRGDSWDYVGLSNYLDKTLLSMPPIGKYYKIGSPNLYYFFEIAFSHLSGFPIINSVMIFSLIVASLIPVASYAVALMYTKKKDLSILISFVFVAFSGFGWVPFFIQKLGEGLRSYSSLGLLTILETLEPKVLADISSGQGSITEGFKTYVLGSLAIIMLIYLFESGLPHKVRCLLIATVVSFAFQVHLEEVLVWTLTFIPIYIILGRKKSFELRTDILSVIIGFLTTFIISLTYPPSLKTDYTLDYILLIGALSAMLGYTFLRNLIKTNMLTHKIGSVKFLLSCLILYLYLFSILVLLLFGFSNVSTEYGLQIVSSGLDFPWYYYPLSFGVTGLLMIIGLFVMHFNEENMKLIFFIIIGVLAFGKLVSYININYFTGEREWRIIYRDLPVYTSLFGGWVFYRLIESTRNNTLLLKLKLLHAPTFRFHLRSLALPLFVAIIILGVPSTILSSEFWMVSDRTPNGPASTGNEDLSAINYVLQNLSTTLRVATSSAGSNALIKLTGNPTSLAQNYIDLLSESRPETMALASSDVGYFYINSERESVNLNPAIDLFPLLYNNSLVTIRELPSLEPPTTSSVGYCTPLSYDNRTFTSYLLLAMLNSSFETVYSDDLYDKSVLFSLSDLQSNPMINVDLKPQYFFGDQYSDTLFNLPMSLNADIYRYVLLTWQSASVPLQVGLHGDKNGYRFVDLGTSSERKQTLIDLQSFFDTSKHTILSFKNESIDHLLFRVKDQSASFSNNTFSVNSITFLKNNLLVGSESVLDWVNKGGTLVVFGDQPGAIFEMLGLRLGETVKTDELSVGGKTYLIGKEINPRTLIVENESTVKNIGYYSLKGSKTSPFVLQKSFGNGKILYFYLDPIFTLLESQKNELSEIQSLASILSDTFLYANISLPKGGSFARFPIEKRWTNRYGIFGENSFMAEGKISVNSSLMGSYILQYPEIARKVSIESPQLNETLKNVTIGRINVVGKAELKILSNKMSLFKQTIGVPSYIPLQFDECTVEIRAVGNSQLEIALDNQSYLITGGDVSINFDLGFFLIKNPWFDIDGSIKFDNICLPSVTNTIWSQNVKLTGEITFHIDYSDGTYFFSSKLQGLYSTEIFSTLLEITNKIPWADIFLSPLNLLIIFMILVIALIDLRLAP